MKIVKYMTMLVAAAVTVVALANEISLAEARAQISECATNPEKMAEIMSQLSPTNQVTFVGDVNAAIEKMPGSNEEKAAAYLNANKAAIKSAQKGNMTAIIAEVYATVPPEDLTVINERFAAELFNRAADPSVTYTDEQFTAIAKAITEKVAARTAGGDNADVRNAFAILMFVRASNGSPADLAATLSENISEVNRDTATSEWIPAALGQDREATYDPMLGVADAGEEPVMGSVLRLAGPQGLDAMLADIYGDVAMNRTPFLDQMRTSLEMNDTFAEARANTPGWKMVDKNGKVVDVPWNPSAARGKNPQYVPGSSTIVPNGGSLEPNGYQNQTLGY